MNMYLWQCSALIWTDTEVTLANRYGLFALYYKEKTFWLSTVLYIYIYIQHIYIYIYMEWQTQIVANLRDKAILRDKTMCYKKQHGGAVIVYVDFERDVPEGWIQACVCTSIERDLAEICLWTERVKHSEVNAELYITAKCKRRQRPFRNKMF